MESSTGTRAKRERHLVENLEIWKGLCGNLGADEKKADISLTVEHIFSVAGPDLVVCLFVGEGAGTSGVAGHHVEACIS